MVLAQAGVAGHLRIGAGAFVGPQCGVHKDVPPGTRVLGSPQRERTYHREMRGALAPARAAAPRARARAQRSAREADDA